MRKNGDFDSIVEKAMKKVSYNTDEFTRQKTKHTVKPKKTEKNAFIKNLYRIVSSLERRRIDKKQAVKQLKALMD